MSGLSGYLAHEGEVHTEQSAVTVSSLLHRPTWQGLLLSLAILVAVYLLLQLFGLKVAQRLLGVVAMTIVLGVLFLPHNATVTAILLSAGFISTFLLTFTLLGKH